MRIFVTNKLPEHTTIHWHGMLLPNGMDGVGGLNPAADPGRARPSSTSSTLTQVRHLHVPPARRRDGADGDGHDGLHRRAPEGPGVHARRPRLRVPASTRTTSSPGSYTPKVSTMLDFNLWTWNSRVFPGIDPLVVRKGDRVRIRIGNLTMTNHPIHLHGHDFEVDRHRRRLGAEGGALAGGDRRHGGRPDARDRVRRRRRRATGRSTATSRTTR